MLIDIKDFSAVITAENAIYFTDGRSNALFSYDIFESKCSYVGSFLENNDEQGCLFGTASKYKDSLIYIPIRASNIGIYDIKKREFAKQKLPIYLSKPGSVVVGKIFKDTLILVGYLSEYIVRYNFINNEFDIIYEGDTSLFLCDICIHNSKIYAISDKRGTLFIYDLETKTSKFIEIDKKGYNSIVYKNGKLFLTPFSDNDFIIIDIDNENIHRIKNLYGQYDESYLYGCVIGSYYYAVPWKKGKIIKININDYTCMIDEFYEKSISHDSHVSGCTVYEDILFILRADIPEMIIYDISNKIIDNISLECQMSKKLIDEIYWANVMLEHSSFRLEDLINNTVL